MNKKLTCIAIAIIMFLPGLQSQNPVHIGNGSFAEYPPLQEAAKPFNIGAASWGDQSQRFIHKQIYVVDTNTRAIPTNDWWTDLINSQYSGDLFAYPGVVNAEDYGIYIKFPKIWNYNGTALESKSKLEIRGDGFHPESAVARRWGDWTFDFLMKESDTKYMAVTTGHGLPFTWFEFTGVAPQIVAQTATYFNASGNAITFPYTGDYFGIETNGDQYGIFAPTGTTFSLNGNTITVAFTGLHRFLSIATLPSKTDLSFFYNYAYSIPRDSKVTWSYNANQGKITTNWTLTTENLKGGTETNVIQGWIPHHYKNSNVGFGFNSFTYATARGLMKCAVGKSFTISYQFNGILPNLPEPQTLEGSANPYSLERMNDMITNYSGKAGYGGDTYWGGKDVMYMGQYMMFAKETGNTQAFETLKSNLKTALEDWYTYTPGETEHYFAYYPNWKSLVGMNASYGSDEFNDHHFHYGYYTYATAMLGFYDSDFINKYGEIAKLVAKDYANWDRNDTRLPMFRNFDAWCGHSWAGGIGDAINGNGQESSSEAIQGWGGLYLLGVATGDNAMRDAGIFGWTLESKAIAEYWFDRDKENIDYTKYTKPYNSNITGQGIGWWTWFSGDPVWMHSIQWMPISPIQKHLYEDTAFAAWDYNQMWQKKELGGWDSNMGNESGIGNVVLSYLQISNPDSAASLFDNLWSQNKATAKDNYTGGITYYYTHSHRFYGEIQWDKYTNIPTSTVYYNSKTGKTFYVVYNPLETEQLCRVYNNSGEEITSFNVPAKKLIAQELNQTLSEIKVTSSVNTVEPLTDLQITATGFDQYGASMNTSVVWTVSGSATISNTGVFSATTNGSYTVTATSGSILGSKIIRVGNAPILNNIIITPSSSKVNIGSTLQFSAMGYDQYGDVYNINPEWTYSNADSISNSGLLYANTVGVSTVSASFQGITGQAQVSCRYPLTNIALGKPAISLQDENVGTVASNATDGFMSTRWSSYHADDMWIYIDLKARFEIEKVILKWEAAYGKMYKLQVSDNTTDWTDVYNQTNGGGGNEEVLLNGTGRYIRLLCSKRATEWGYSLYEFEVYGTAITGVEPQLAYISITPGLSLIKDNETIQLQAKGYDQFGNDYSINPTWQVLGSGSIANGLYSPTENTTGAVDIIAKDGFITGTSKVIVEPTYKATAIEITPATTITSVMPLSIGIPQRFTATVYDQFKNPFPNDVSWSVNGGGTITQDGFFIPTEEGEFMVFAQKSGMMDTAFINIAPLSSANIALFKPISVSSYENEGTNGAKAVDNSLATRWSSAWTTNEWLQVDLQNTYSLTTVVVNWEAASAKKYIIQTSVNGTDWTTAYTQNTGKGGKETINVTGNSARYIKLNCTERTLAAYGYSLFEFEVYASGVTITPQLSYISIKPGVVAVQKDSTQQFTAYGYDQFGNLFPADISYSTSGGGIISDSGIFKALVPGTFRVVAQSNNIKSAALVNVISVAFDGSYYWEKDTTIIDTTTEEPDYIIINPVEDEISVSVYPNPVTDILNVKLSNENYYNSLAIFDLTGRVIFQKNILYNNAIMVDTRAMKNGLYLVKISGIKGSKTFRVVK